MAGKRQHFIPRFLQKGFASHTKGDEVFTWVHRKGQAAFNANIEKVGAETYFYTERDDTQADDSITDVEGSFSELAERLRAAQSGPVADERIPQLIAHLEIRTRHFRKSFLATGDFLVSRLLDFLADPDAFIPFFERRLQRDPTAFRKVCAEELSRRNLAPVFLEPIVQIAMSSLPAFLAEIRPQLPMLAAALRAMLPEKLKEAAKSGHIRALKQTIAPPVKIGRYETLSYTVADFCDGDLILGDSGVLFEVEGPCRFRTFWGTDNIMHALYLPLAPRRALIGARDSTNVLGADLRRAIARCSLEHFIAAERSDANNLLKEEIGQDAAFLTREQAEEILTELMNE